MVKCHTLVFTRSLCRTENYTYTLHMKTLISFTQSLVLRIKPIFGWCGDLSGTMVGAIKQLMLSNKSPGTLSPDLIIKVPLEKMFNETGARTDWSDRRKKVLLYMNSTDLATDREKVKWHTSNTVIYYCNKEKGVATEEIAVNCWT